MANKHILVVDDEQSVRKTIVAILQKKHYLVTEASSGAEALNRAKQQQFDLILTDVMMPQMHGFELIQALRQLSSYASTPIACFSGATKEESIHLFHQSALQFDQLHIHDWLTKPIDPRILIERVAALLTHSDNNHLLVGQGDKYAISSTVSDLDGFILACSKGTTFNSGYASEELIGQPHSIFRHPDVPSVVFEQLWKAIMSGENWIGVVKNKRKDGTGYWISLQVSPVFDGGKIIAYKSVRFPATEAEVKAAESRFQQIKQGGRSVVNEASSTSAEYSNTSVLDILSLVAILIPSFIFLVTGILSTEVAILFMLFSLGISGLVAYRLQVAKRISPSLKQSIEDLMNDRLRNKIHGSSELALSLERLRIQMAMNLANRYDLNYEDSFNHALMSMITANLLLLNEDFHVVTLSDSMRKFFIQHEEKIRGIVPDFNSNKLIGSSLNIFELFSKNIRVSSDRLSTGCIEFDLDNLIIRLRSQKILDDAGNVRAYILELQDRTEQTIVIKQISQAIEAMKDGDFSVRVTAQTYDPDLMFIKNDINSAMDRLAITLEVIVAVVMAQSNGDMTNELNGEYHGQFEELQRVMNISIARLRDILKQTQEASNLVHDTSRTLIQRSESLAEQSQLQVKSISETNQTMNIIASSVQDNTEHAKTAAQLTHQVQEQTQEGAAVMQKTIAAMQDIQASSQKINDIVTLIDSIAFQTNLLALNAAVEAARAGEHGRGFAVVAGEVRNLALKSANAAKDIKTLIHDSVSRIQLGTQLADQSGEMLNTIARAINDVAQMVEGIATASVTQSIQIDSVHHTITNVNQVTEQYNLLVEEIISSSKNLEKEAQKLEDNTDFFKLGKGDREEVVTDTMFF